MQESQAVPKQLQPYQRLIDRFLSNFNPLCQRTGRNYISIESFLGHEDGRSQRCAVIYKSQYVHKKWTVYGEYKRFLFFKKKFPLFEIHIIIDDEGKNIFSFSGLYTQGFKKIPFDEHDFYQALDEYQDNCMRVPIDAFTKG